MKHKGIRRFFNHLLHTPLHTRKHFPKAVLARIEAAIKASERSHLGEIRFVVEGDLHPLHILQAITPRQRAIALFSQLRIWDTEQNNGVLIYLLLADRDVEIVADRGIHQHVGAEAWEVICKAMEGEFRHGAFEKGVLLGLDRISALLQQHYPASASASSPNVNELPDAPIAF